MLAKQKIIDLICQQLPDIQAIYLFGSANSAYEKSDSDVDLAFLATKKIEPMKRWQVQQELAILLDKDVDLIDLWQASEVLRWQVISTGQRIYCQKKKTCEAYENTVFSAYLRLNDERKDILEEIQKRGQVL